eukprot:Sro590_g171920.1 LRR receptor-like serine threonine-protein kinase (408) ;mRNA; r:43589-45093
MAPTTTRDAVEAPKIEIGLAIILGKNYFQHAEDIGEGNDSEIDEFMLETRQSAFHWIVNQDPMQLEFDAPNLVQRFLLVLFYYQTTRHQQWKECNPPATPQGSASIKFCYKPDIVTGESTSDSGVISGSLPVMNASGLGGESAQWTSPTRDHSVAHLNRLDLHGNMLSVMLPPKLLSFSLESLHWGNNQLTGPFPARWFESLHGGTTIPSDVGMPPLKTLRLGNNSLTGSLPLEMFQLSALGFLAFDQNDHTGIAGTLPSEIGLATQLLEFDASYSNMEGRIPEELYAKLTDLVAFMGNDCNFSGTISSSLGRLTGLQWLGLANNNFDGTIPNEIESLTDLRRLEVNGNQFTGTVPVSVCKNLAYFTGDVAVVADCLPNPGTGVPTIECGDDCCTSCCDNTGVCLAD